VSTDHTVRVWDVGSGALARTIKPDSNVNAVTLCKGGTSLFTMGYPGVLQWDMATGTQVSEPIDHTVYLAFDAQSFRASADGSRVAVIPGGEARIGETPRASDSVPDWLPQLAEVVAGQSMNEQGIAVRVAPDEFLRLRESILRSTSDDSYRRWAKWFFAD